MAKIDDLIDEIQSIGNRPDLRRWREEIQKEVIEWRERELVSRQTNEAKIERLIRDTATVHTEAQVAGRKNGLEEAAMMIEEYAHFLKRQNLGTTWTAIRQFADKIRFAIKEKA